MYNVFVCIEYQGDVARLAGDLTEKLASKIPAAVRTDIHEHRDKYENEIETQLKNHKSVTHE